MTTSTMTAEEQQSLLLQLLDPAVRADPYPVYRRFREGGPLQMSAANLVVLADYQDCHDVLRHPASLSDGMKSTVAQRYLAEGHELRPNGPPGFLFLDPPDHTRLRRLASKAFAPRVVKALTPEITTLVDALLDTVADRGGPFDVIADLAYPLPVAVICRLLGVPIDDEPQFGRASALLAQSLDPFTSFTGELPEDYEQRMEAGLWLRDYFRDLIAQRRGRLGDDLLSGLIAVEEAGDQLTEDEIVATCNLLLVAGHETTVNLIANAILAMLRNPSQWAALAADSGRAAAVIEETLRYDPPVQLVGRVAGEDMPIGDIVIDKGDNVMLLLAAAQRDPGANDDPDVFNPDRDGVRHLAFGHGPHFCLGAPLARLEAGIALSAVTARFPHARIDGEPTYKPNVTLRGMASLPVAI